jgi:hypothetical protein
MNACASRRTVLTGRAVAGGSWDAFWGCSCGTCRRNYSQMAGGGTTAAAISAKTASGTAFSMGAH